MKVLVLGATGRTGRVLVELARARHHHVTSFVGDPCSAELLASGMRGHDAVVSALGPRSLSRTVAEIYPWSATSVLEAVRVADVRRVLVISSALLFPKLGPLAGILRFVMRNALDGAREMEEIITTSDLDWTIARPGRLIDGPPSEAYRVAAGALPEQPRPIARADVAHFLVHEFEEGQHLREVVGLSGAAS